MSRSKAIVGLMPVLEPEMRILDKIPASQDRMLADLMDWSHINSGSTNRDGLKRMRAVLKDAYAALPAEPRDAELSKGELISSDGAIRDINYEPALLVQIRPEAKIQLVLTGHYDTVFPMESHFQETVRIDGDTLGGPGVADMKGGILVMLEALKAFEQSEQAQQVGYSVLLSPDEEIGSPGSAAFLSELGRQAHIGLTFEPSLSDGVLAGARKGSGNFALVIKGRAAHAGREHHLGRNAINAMARFTVGLDALNGGREGVTFNMAKIDGGGPDNIVPEVAVGRFNIRILKPEDRDWVMGKLSRLIREINAEDGIEAKLTGKFTRAPKPMAPANALVFDWVRQAGAALGIDIRWKMSGGVCEGNNLWESGCPNVDTLGVVGGDIHSDREFMKISSLAERAQLSALILMKIASGEFDARHAKALAKKGK